MRLGSIEAGGTKFVLGIGNENGEIVDRIVLPTRTPEETIPEVIDYFRKHHVEALGIGSFGPVDIRKSSPTYGSILNTPKLAWKNYPFLQRVKEALGVPIGFTTDVNAAALGEKTFGAAKGLNSCLYITIGTGIGAGAVIHGKLLEGLSHPEMGHTIVVRHPEDSFEGVCPYHKGCLEGLASGPAIERRWGKKGADLAGERKVWELEAFYIAQALVQYILILMPEKIIIGGGVSNVKEIFPLIRNEVTSMLNNYISLPEVNENIKEYIVPPALGGNSGLVGGFVLAQNALD